jgi:hypothetical protein
VETEEQQPQRVAVASTVSTVPITEEEMHIIPCIHQQNIRLNTPLQLITDEVHPLLTQTQEASPAPTLIEPISSKETAPVQNNKTPASTLLVSATISIILKVKTSQRHNKTK